MYIISDVSRQLGEPAPFNPLQTSNVFHSIQVSGGTMRPRDSAKYSDNKSLIQTICKFLVIRKQHSGRLVNGYPAADRRRQGLQTGNHLLT